METMQTEAQRAKTRKELNVSGQGTVFIDRGEKTTRKLCRETLAKIVVNLMKTVNPRIQDA